MSEEDDDQQVAQSDVGQVGGVEPAKEDACQPHEEHLPSAEVDEWRTHRHCHHRHENDGAVRQRPNWHYFTKILFDKRDCWRNVIILVYDSWILLLVVCFENIKLFRIKKKLWVDPSYSTKRLQQSVQRIRKVAHTTERYMRRACTHIHIMKYGVRLSDCTGMNCRDSQAGIC